MHRVHSLNSLCCPEERVLGLIPSRDNSCLSGSQRPDRPTPDYHLFYIEPSPGRFLDGSWTAPRSQGKHTRCNSANLLANMGHLCSGPLSSLPRCCLDSLFHQIIKLSRPSITCARLFLPPLHVLPDRRGQTVDGTTGATLQTTLLMCVSFLS